MSAVALTRRDDPARYLSALRALSPNLPREDWFRVACAFKDAGGSLDEFDEWSAGGESYDKADVSSMWRSIKPGKITAATLIAMAHDVGWKDDGAHAALSSEEIAKCKAERALLQAEEAEAEARHQAEAAERAQRIWDGAQPAANDHPYLLKKKIQANGIRVGRWEHIDRHTGEVRLISDNALLVPLRIKSSQPPLSLQAILPEKLLDNGKRDKDNLEGGRTSGLYHAVGLPKRVEGRLVIVIAEGYANGASIHEATGHGVVVAFGKGNLLSVAKLMRERAPGADIIIFSDRDAENLSKSGGTKAALRAAMAVGARVVVPDWTGKKGRDANDIHIGGFTWGDRTFPGKEVIDGCVRYATPYRSPAFMELLCECGLEADGDSVAHDLAGQVLEQMAGAIVSGELSCSQGMPEIELREGERARVIRELAAAFAGRAPYYRRDALLVRAVTLPADEDSGGVWRSRGSVVLRPATTHAVISDASRYASIVRYDRRSKMLAPRDLPDGVAASFCTTAVEENALPSIVGVVRCPIMREDGSLHVHHGYDPETRLILAGDENWSELDIPERPTVDHARSALQWLLDTAFADFPFADEASKSVAISALLTAVIRPAIPCAPVHAFSAPQYGAGKSLQAEFAAIVATGVKPGMVAPGHSQEEFEKRVDAAIIEGDPVVVLDNLSRPLSGDNLCAAITSDTAKVRPLGSSVAVKVRTSAFWMATGMNLSVKRDMHRRTVIGYVDAGMEHPETRSGFKIADLKGWAALNRMRILSAVYTMLRAHANAGYPAVGEKALGNFEDWSRRVANCLVWLDLVNPVLSQERLRADDPEIQNRIVLFRALVSWQQSRKAIGNSVSWTIHDLRTAVSGSMVGDSFLGDAISAGIYKGIEGMPFWTRTNKNVTVSDNGINYKLQRLGGARGGIVRWEVAVSGGGDVLDASDHEPAF